MWLRPLRVLLGAAFRADRARTLANMLVVPFGLLLSTLFGLWQKLAVDAVVAHRPSALVTAALLFGGSAALSALISAGSAKVRVELEDRVGLELERSLIDAATSAPYLELHERPDFQDRLELLRDNRRRLGQPMTALCLLLGAFAPALGTVLLLWSIHPALLLLVVFVVPNIITSRRAVARARATDEANAPQRRQARHVCELLTVPSSAKEVRLTAATAALRSRHRSAFRTATGAVRRAQLRSDAEAAAVRGLFAVCFAAAVLFLIGRILHGQATVGDLVLAFSVIRRTTADLAAATNSTGQFSQQLETIRRLVWLTDYTDAQIATAPRGPLQPRPVPDLGAGVRLRGVSFTYPGTDRTVLHDITLDLPARSVVAVVGENGAGKTTLVKLLAALYPTTSQVVLVSGQDLQQVSPTDWQRSVTAVFQDFLTPHLTLREAVAIGGRGNTATDPEVLAALATAGAADLLQHGLTLDSQLGPAFGGPELSRGQWQKLALARAACRPSGPLLLLDEPSASLDPLSEAAVFDGVDCLLRRTANAGGVAVVVSHRLALVTAADLVVFLRDGRVVACGPHEQLVDREPGYAELFALQARSYA